MIAAKNGCRLAKIEARAGPTSSMAVNQQQVRQHERAEHGEGETDPGERRRCRSSGLRAAARRAAERDRDDAEEDRAEPERRVAAHERRNGDRVCRPRSRRRAPRAGRRRGSPETLFPEPAVTRTTPANESPAAIQNRRASRSIPTRREMSAGEDRQRPEEERRGGGGRQVEREDEAELVDEQQDDGERDERQVAAADPERALARERERDEHERGRRVAERRVRKRAQAGVEDVLRDREVERPDGDGQQQHQVGC